MLVIPTQPLPSQTLTVSLSNQRVQLNIYQKGQLDYYALYMDVFLNDALVVGGAICLNAHNIVRYAYLGFPGDMAFFDTQGSDNPDYTGLGPRWFLAYLP